MKLLIDIGNTRLKWAWADGDHFSGQGSILTHAATSQIPSLIKANMPPSGSFDVWISSVTKKSVLSHVVNAWFNTLPADQVHVVRATDKVEGFSNNYADLDKLGIDRWVAAVGARHLQPQGDLLIVDAGTAVTIDLLDADNVYQGGAILPGPKLMHDALVRSTAGIKSEFSSTRQIIGKDTIECVNSGVSFGLVGAVENIINEMKKVINQPSKILLTGGAANELAEQLETSIEFCPDLVLTGLLAISSKFDR